MKAYIKPNLNVVELSVKESIAALRTRSTKDFGFGSKGSALNKISTTLATLTTSDLTDAVQG